MAEQIHKKFTNEQVKDLMQRYLNGEIKRQHVQTILKIGKSRFFALVQSYRQNPEKFTIAYQRTRTTRGLDTKISKNILKELAATKKFIENKDMPIWSYNYTFIKNDLKQRYHQKVCVQTVINLAKKNDFYIPRTKKPKSHDREVITNQVGELIQHDSSYHLWSPHVEEKWWLITSLDDFSRLILYAMLVLRDTTLPHIRALQTVFLKFGLPLTFYVDSDRVFRFVPERDKRYYQYYPFDDEADPQWKQILRECQVKVSYALSPEAKGKIERPYRWIQDHLVRICARDNITTIAQANQILFREVYEYNYKRVHSTTLEIPYLRYQRAIKENKNLFRPFLIPPPFQSIKDIFCFRFTRVVDNYRMISINNLKLRFNKAPIHETVNVRVYPHQNSDLSEIRFWFKDKLLDIQKVKTSLILPVHF